MKKGAVRNKPLEYVNLLTYIATTAVNIVAGAGLLNGITTAQISDSLPNLFVPAGLTFAIWGVIYVVVGVFAVYQFTGYASDLVVHRISYWFAIANVANLAWIVLWQYLVIPLTLPLMLVLLISLLAIYLKLGPYSSFSKENLVVRMPFSIYLGWITVATVANVTALLVYWHWDHLGIAESIWAVLVIAVAVLICLILLLTRKDIPYSLVIAWALLGILLKRLGDEISVAATAGVGMAAILVLIVVVWFISWRGKPRNKK